MTPAAPTLAAIHRYPVKSCRGHALAAATVEPWGLAGDRRWMLVDADGVFVTARQHHRLLRITPEPCDRGLLVRAAGTAPLFVAEPAGTPRDVRIWRDTVAATPAAADAHAWFSDVLGTPVRLVHLDDPTRRPTNPGYGLDSDVVSFADGYPLLAATEGSLAELNALIGDPRPLPMARFRPSLVIAGTPAWSEDGWRRVRVGEAVFRVVKASDRCVVTTIDPATGATGPEPLRTMARHRRWDGKTWFGVNLVPDTPGAVVRVGDPIDLLDVVEGSAPLR